MQTPPEYKKIKHLFLRQSYLDSWEDYEKSIQNESYIRWDYIILTASNSDQAEAYQSQISFRLKHHLLPATTKYVVLPDPDGKRVGSGGATFNVLRYIAEQDIQKDTETADAQSQRFSTDASNHFANKRILVIHSGGDSKRIPQYSACGKLFSPVPRELPNGYPSTLFDEFIIAMSGIPSRIKEGMLILSGDVLLLFNPLQLDFQYHGAAAISIKEHVNTGKDHGVFLNDGHDHVDRFLHKQSIDQLRALGAVNDHDHVDLDTGAVIMDSDLLNALYSLISTNNQPDQTKFNEFVNENSRISFYGDFLYPLARKSTLEQYYTEAPEGEFCQELHDCRTKLWEALHNFNMKLLCLSPAEFIHFGTTAELLSLVTTDIADYEFLDWKRSVITNVPETVPFASHNSLIEDASKVGASSYIENSKILGSSNIGNGSVVSNLTLRDISVPGDVVLHGLRLKSGKYIVRIYGVHDNPKGTLEQDTFFLGQPIRKFMDNYQLTESDIWPDQPAYLWFANLYPICDTMEQAVHYAIILYHMAHSSVSVGETAASTGGTALSADEIAAWKTAPRMSLYSSFNEADVKSVIPWTQELKTRILVDKFIHKLESGVYYKEALAVFGISGIRHHQFDLLLEKAEIAPFSTKIRIYYAVSRFMKEHSLIFGEYSYDKVESLCFETIQLEIYNSVIANIKNSDSYRICKDRVDVSLPVRVNWGGGWSDTPPHCNECGGVVLNAALKLRGTLPIQITLKRLPEYHVEFESQDIGVFGTVEDAADIQNCHDPFDPFALHKAALIACGVIPLEGPCHLSEHLKKLGGGIYLSTQVIGVPKGSGLGTSSILSGACVKGIFEFLGQDLSDNELYDIVLCMEQVMSTGGGWQDQVGGLTPGVKYCTTTPGILQKIQVEQVHLSDQTKKEINDRYALIYTGQRRLARNLLRDVVGGYIGSRPESIHALHDIQRLAALMKFELERDNVDGFAELINQHWELSKQLDHGSTNTCIDQIFLSCEDLIDARFIAGAGGGGFIQVIMKKGVTHEQLRERLRGVFQDSGVDVWDCEVLYD